ncbi:MAG TPA: hypothetical protein VK661_13215 [Planctomycetota bacterium]|nr:hypothetical protein [Planctomycetota bacterium]
MRLWQLGGIVALLVGVGAAQERAQEKKAEKCSMAGICCPKDGKCTGECRAICDRAGETLKAARKLAGEKMQAKYNFKCECTAGECATEGCEGCSMIRTKIFAPLMKERVGARMKDWKKEITHAVKGKDGRTETVKCTFLKGAPCDSCVDTLSDDILKKLQAFTEEQKKK